MLGFVPQPTLHFDYNGTSWSTQPRRLARPPSIENHDAIFTFLHFSCRELHGFAAGKGCGLPARNPANFR